MTFSFIFIMDILGTIAFAISGAMVAIRKEMDLFGVNILAITTAVGGGIIRDLLIGHTPPEMFHNPIYTLTAVITANIVFCVIWMNKKNASPSQESKFYNIYEKALFLCDTLGLAAFTVDGVNAGVQSEMSSNLFLVVFLGVITGVGGGVMRDVMAVQRPYIFVKHIYACASLLGALFAAILWKPLGQTYAMMIGFAITMVIRLLAAYFELDLPRIRK